MIFKNILAGAVIIVLIFSHSACVSSKKLVYFPTMNDTSITIVNKNFEPTIQAGDILLINVTSLDPNSSALFNSVSSGASSGTGAGSGAGAGSGLLVNVKGEIEITKLGKIVAMGKTKTQLSAELQEALLPYLKDPVVSIRFMNYRITVLGEVKSPSIILVPNERISILEAIGQCGDLTTQANRTNILLIHENNSNREFHRINLNDNSLFKSPYYYLQSNDVLYIEPNKIKAYSSSLTPVILPTILGAVSVLLLLLNYLRK